MPQRYVSAAELSRLRGGSTSSHKGLVDACLELLALARIPAVPVSTTGIPIPNGDGTYRLAPNDRQEGLSDILACVPPAGRLVLIETKTGQASRTAAQREMQARFAAAGAITVVVRSTAQLVDLIAGQLGILPAIDKEPSCSSSARSFVRS